MKLVEGVEKALLGLLLAADEVNIVDEEHADAAVLVAELLGIPIAQGNQELIGELFGGGADNVNVVGRGGMPDGMQKVGLAQPRSGVNEQRIIAVARVLGDGQGGGPGKSIAAAFDEEVKDIFRIKTGIRRLGWWRAISGLGTEGKGLAIDLKDDLDIGGGQAG